MFTPGATSTAAPLVYYIDADHLGTPRVVFDTNGSQRWNWISEPFGTTAANQNPANLGLFYFNLRMPGQIYDSEAGLFYNWNRYYDPSTGRYVQFDPIGLAGGSLSPYMYVNGSPLRASDSNGLWASQMGFYMHQDAILDIVKDDVTLQQAMILWHSQDWVDSAPNQAASRAFMHAMRNGDASQSAADACSESNRFMQNVIARSIAAKKGGDINQSLFLFGVALHTMQDSTSPSHRGFQPWSNHVPWYSEAWHAMRESYHGNDLYAMTALMYQAYKNNDASAFKFNCPCSN